jgi:hypothetical protein
VNPLSVSLRTSACESEKNRGTYVRHTHTHAPVGTQRVSDHCVTGGTLSYPTHSVHSYTAERFPERTCLSFSHSSGFWRNLISLHYPSLMNKISVRTR